MVAGSVEVIDSVTGWDGMDGTSLVKSSVVRLGGVISLEVSGVSCEVISTGLSVVVSGGGRRVEGGRLLDVSANEDGMNVEVVKLGGLKVVDSVMEVVS